ncbi:MAG: polysaccharide deacetylase [Clostridia bacterium]|nr:polysaccharide deacetylase [Clostridia bacterium]
MLTYKATDNSGNVATNERFVAVSQPGKVIAQDGTQGKKGVIYLTFDDGPTQSSTPQILDILDKKGVKATFFILNFDEAGAELVKREYESGHTVAIHGYSHTYSAIYQSVDTYVNNVTKLQDKIYETIGIRPTITRFPGGSSNTISRHYASKIMTTLAYEMVGRGYTYFDWNVDSDDAGSAKTSEDIYRNVTTHLSKNQANVVLMHDFASNTKTIGALERVIDYGLENGYTFEVITPDTQMVTHTTNN